MQKDSPYIPIIKKLMKDYIERIIALSSICVLSYLLILSSIKLYLNYLGFTWLFEFYGHSEAILIWMLFGIYLMRYMKYQFFIVLIPLYWISDILWNTASYLVYNCAISITLLNPHWTNYMIILTSLSILIMLFFKLRVNRKNLSVNRVTIFISWFTFYIIMGVPIISNICTKVITPFNIIYEITWQIVFLFTFGKIFATQTTPNSYADFFRWMFNI